MSVVLYHTITYHPGRHGLDLPRTTLRPIKMTQCTSPKKERRIGSVSRCRWCAATATFFAGSACVCVCKGERGEIEGLVPIILRARPVR